MKVYVETYGCAANKNNSEIIITKALSAGHEIVSKEEDADLVVINTCTVKHLTEQKILHRIKTLKQKPLIVTGCMVPIQAKKVKRINADADLIPWNELDAFEDIFGKPKKKVYFSYDQLIKIVQINVGCVGNCSYCIVKKIKDQLISKSIDEIVKEVREGIKHGAKEIYLTSTDTAAYGFDMGSNLYELVASILDEVKGDYKIRIGMMNPMPFMRFYDKFMGLFRDDRLYKFLHLPVQSGSEKVLREMNRPTNLSKVMEIKKKFHEIVGEKGFLATDIIVGYPTENDFDFKQTISFLEEFMPDMTHVSKYGPRDFTEAKRLRPLPSDVIKERSVKLTQLTKQLALKRNAQWQNEITEVLVTQEDEDIAVGRNSYYKVVRIPRESKESLVGRRVKVKIVNYSSSSLEGEMI
ncbi:MAG: tRNA (N(6)-L-threonylcarbamoyladenosine(37)-C(2))-methylthiotransferase [Candidatus Nanohaloarchaeota archaeon]|nr:tRNA (N(6)-L-threonylcarbamoyladenosine(37)-C(2))-methylthiotransferase [Candidatus Nanohaloarchaeota archaeon]